MRDYLGELAAGAELLDPDTLAYALLLLIDGANARCSLKATCTPRPGPDASPSCSSRTPNDRQPRTRPRATRNQTCTDGLRLAYLLRDG